MQSYKCVEYITGSAFYSIWKDFDLGDFNVGTEEQHMKASCDNYNLTSLIKQSTCYKNPNNPTCIDLMTLIYWFVLFNDINCHEKVL